MFYLSPMKMILSTPNFDPQLISNLNFDRKKNNLSFEYKNKKYEIEVTTAEGSFLKVENGDFEIINKKGYIS